MMTERPPTKVTEKLPTKITKRPDTIMTIVTVRICTKISETIYQED